MNSQQLTTAITAGLELLGTNSKVQVPVSLNDGVFFLRQLLTGIARGEVTVAGGGNDKSAARPTEKGEKDDDPETAPSED